MCWKYNKAILPIINLSFCLCISFMVEFILYYEKGKNRLFRFWKKKRKTDCKYINIVYTFQLESHTEVEGEAEVFMIDLYQYTEESFVGRRRFNNSSWRQLTFKCKYIFLVCNVLRFMFYISRCSFLVVVFHARFRRIIKCLI